MATQPAVIGESNVPALTPEGERFALRQRQARMFATSPLVPEHLRKGTPEQALANCYIALTLAEAMGEVPLVVMQNIHIVNGKAGFATQYMIARANASGIFRGRIDWRIDRSDPANLSVTAFAVLKDTGQEVSVTCDMKMAQAEQWTKNPKYRTMGEVMLRYRSAAFLVRFYAPDVMLGYHSTEEIEDVAIAGGPDLTAVPLTGAMLIRQASGGEGEDDTVIDATTGEVIEADDPSANDGTLSEDNPTAAEGRSDEDYGEAHNGSEDAAPAWAAAVASLRELIRSATTKAHWNRADSEFQKIAAGLPDDVREELDAALNAASKAISRAAKVEG